MPGKKRTTKPDTSESAAASQAAAKKTTRKVRETRKSDVGGKSVAERGTKSASRPVGDTRRSTRTRVAAAVSEVVSVQGVREPDVARVVDEVALTASISSPSVAPRAGADVAQHIPEPPVSAPGYVPPTTIPDRYGRTYVVLMVKDPNWLHAYWEITGEAWAQAQKVMREVWDRTVRVLRLFEGNDSTGYRDIELTDQSESWYFQVDRTGATYQVALGLRGPKGMFYEFARSNTVTTPTGRVSDVVEERWARADAEFDELYRGAAEIGHHAPSGSVDFKELTRRWMEEQVSSGALSSWLFSMGSGALQERRRERGFWFVVNTELIVYGATEPDATVTVQGHPVKLREDGTFTLRFALPDGEQVIPCTARSGDEIETRTITPIVTKRTETREPVIDHEKDVAFRSHGGR